MTAKHVIRRVEFSRMAEEGRPMSEAPLECSCGARVTSGTWESHRGDTSTMARLKRNREERAA